MTWIDPVFGALFLGGYLGLLTLLWGGMMAGVGAWHRTNALPEPATPTDGVAAVLPRVSICIPARDEAHQIAECVRACLAQDHPELEVVVVDDGSTDGTAAVARAAGAGDPRLRVVTNAPLPSGWAGKPWACARAAAEANGAHLLFIDADVVLAPDAARRACATLAGQGVSLLSLFGTWRLESFWENVSIPVIGWFIRGATDVAAVNAPARPEAFANGQFILVERGAYDAVGGHGAVRAEVLEDVRLARAFKQRGLPIALHAAPWAFRVRLYRSLGEVMAGYGKNLYEGMDRRPSLALGALFFLFVGAGVPWGLLAGALWAPTIVLAGRGLPSMWTAWIALVCLLPIGFGWAVERADGRSGFWAWTHPLGNVVLAAVLVRAIARTRTTWKGRAFDDGKAAA